MFSFITKFLTKGVITSVIGMVTLVLSNTGHNSIAIWLSDPDNMNQIFMIIGAILTLAGGAMPGIGGNGAVTPLPSPKAEENPYPGYVWSSTDGWVKADGNGGH